VKQRLPKGRYSCQALRDGKMSSFVARRAPN
jgi:hypothetical protein